MGGEASGCTEDTTELFLEVALFDPIRTAMTGRKLGINSDARYRFERGLDPQSALWGAEVAARMILDLCGGEASELTVAGEMPELAPQRHAAAGAPEDIRRRRRAAGRGSRHPRSARLRDRGRERPYRRRHSVLAARCRGRALPGGGGPPHPRLRQYPGGVAAARDGVARAGADAGAAARRPGAAPACRPRHDGGGDLVLHGRRRRRACSPTFPRRCAWPTRSAPSST